MATKHSRDSHPDKSKVKRKAAVKAKAHRPKRAKKASAKKKK